MEVLKNKNNMTILSDDKYCYYLISYNSIIAKVINTIDLERVNEKQEYGLYLTSKWNYSQTTLKHLYEFIEDYTTQRDEKGNVFAYQLGQESNKCKYIMKQIELGNIKLVKESDI